MIVLYNLKAIRFIILARLFWCSMPVLITVTLFNVPQAAQVASHVAHLEKLFEGTLNGLLNNLKANEILSLKVIEGLPKVVKPIDFYLLSTTNPAFQLIVCTAKILSLDEQWDSLKIHRKELDRPDSRNLLSVAQKEILIEYQLHFPKLLSQGYFNFNATYWTEMFGQLQFEGNGTFVTKIQNGIFTLSFRTNDWTNFATKFYMEDFNIDFTFEKLLVFTDEASFNYVELNWKNFNERAKPIYNIMRLIYREKINNYISRTFNKFFQNCTAGELFDAIKDQTEKSENLCNTDWLLTSNAFQEFIQGLTLKVINVPCPVHTTVVDHEKLAKFGFKE